MQSLLRFWYGQSPNWVFSHFLGTVHQLDGYFAVRETIKNLNQPLFQDYSRQGRIIGFFFRIGRILLAFFFYFLAFLGYVIAYIFWLLFPVLCVASILAPFFPHTITALQ